MKFIKKYDKLLYVATFILVTLAGIVGFREYDHINGKNYTLLDCLYLSVQLFVLQSGFIDGRIPFLLQFTRFLAPCLTISGIYFVAFYASLYPKLLFLRLKCLENHVIICGLSKKAEYLIDDILDKNKDEKIILIEKNENHDSLESYRGRRGIIIICDSASDEFILRSVNVLKARCLVALTDSDESNIEISKKVAKIFEDHYKKYPYDLEKDRTEENKLRCIIHLENFYHLQAFKDYHEIRVPSNSNTNTAIDFHAINIYEKVAQKMVDDFAPDKFVKVRNPEDPQVEILIFGLTHGGENLLIQSAFIYHFMNLKKIKVFVIDVNVEEKLEKIMNFVPALKELIIIDAIEQTDFLLNYLTKPIKNVSVCFVAKESDGESVYFSKKLRQIFYNINATTALPKVAVFLPKNTKILNLLDNVNSDAESPIINIKFRELYKETCTAKEIIEDEESIDSWSKKLHELYVENERKKSNFQVKLWSEINDGLKDSNRFSARHLVYKIRFAGLKLLPFDTQESSFDVSDLPVEILNLIGETEHNRWMAEKKLNGYLACKPVSDAQMQKELKDKLKLHKDLIESKHLDSITRAKDLTSFLNLDAIIDSADETKRKMLVTDNGEGNS